MTTREPVTTTLILGIIMPLYEMQQEDITALAADLERQVRTEYGRTIQTQLNLYKCQRLATGPDAESTRWIEQYVKSTSEGIARTYNRELSNKIAALHAANVRGNRYYYMRALDTWTRQRNAYKVPSIALNSMTATRQYAAQRFRAENNVTGRMVFVGPPPVCKKCLRLKALGPVSVEQARKYGDAQHVNCPHRWEQLIPKAINCQEAWTG
jgi:hypothetical protein